MENFIYKEIPIEVVALDLGLVLDKHQSGECPTDHFSQSGKCFKLDLKRNRFHCFNCGIDGDTIDLYQLVTGASFAESVNSLSQRYLGINNLGNKVDPKNLKARRPLFIPSPLDIELQQGKKSEDQTGFYHGAMNDYLIHKKGELAEEVLKGALPIADYFTRLILLEQQFNNLDEWVMGELFEIHERQHKIRELRRGSYTNGHHDGDRRSRHFRKSETIGPEFVQ